MKSRQYNFLLGFLIIANSIMTGALTEYQAAHHTSAIPWSFRAPELVFASIFALEIGTRICLHGCSFLTKPGWHWNLFDLIVVIMQVGEDAFSLWMELSHSQSESRRPTTLEMKLFPILSFMRSARIFRLARIFHLIAELRMLLASIANSFRSLLWTVVMLLALTYMVAVYITQFVLDHRLRLTRDDSEEDSAQLLVELYGTLPRSMLTLYESISDGVHWKHVMDPLREEVSPWLALTFSLYISFVIFAMLNLIHGVYVESIIRTASEDKRRVLMMEMHQLFLQADVDGSGTITWEEFGAQLEKSEMRSYLKEIDLDLEEARELFLLLDTEEEGEIDIEQLVNGCVRLHGTAKAMDLAVMMQEMKRMARQLNSHAHVVEEQLTWLVQQSTRMVNDASDTSLEQLQMTALRSQLPKSR
jgi:Ca2+-binding EF-hand superfamily protein